MEIKSSDSSNPIFQEPISRRGLAWGLPLQLSIYLFAFLLPFEDILAQIGLGFFGGIKVLGILIVGSLFLKILADPKEFRTLARNFRTPISLWSFLFIIWSLLSVFWAPNADLALVRVSTYVGLFVVMQAIGLLKREDIKRIWELLLVGIALSVPMGFIAPQSTEIVAASGRFTSGGQDPNDYANLIVVVLGVVFYGILIFKNEVKSRLWRFTLMSSALVAAMAIPLSLSRTALVNLLVIALNPFLLRKTIKSKLIVSVSVVLSLVYFAFSFPILTDQIIQRYSTMRDLQQENVWSGRIDIWRGAITVFSEQPFTGVGTGNFAVVSPYYSYYAAYIASTRGDGGGGVAHNIFLSVLAETGLIGFFLFMSLLLSAYVSTWRLVKQRENLGYGLFIGLVAYTIAGLTLTWEYVKIPYLIYGSLLALQRKQNWRV